MLGHDCPIWHAFASLRSSFVAFWFVGRRVPADAAVIHRLQTRQRRADVGDAAQMIRVVVRHPHPGHLVARAPRLELSVASWGSSPTVRTRDGPPAAAGCRWTVPGPHGRRRAPGGHAQLEAWGAGDEVAWMWVSHYDADHLGGVTDVGASLSGLEAVYNRSVGRDTPPNEPEGDERASKGSERMPNRAIMPKHQVSSREMSVLLRIQANGTHLRP